MCNKFARLMPHSSRITHYPARPTSHVPRPTFYALLLLLNFLLPACTLTPTPANPPPERLYLFDVSQLHLNHYEHCIALTGRGDGCD